MKMIVGLGNPGSKYQATKHNIGFITLDEMAFQQQVKFSKSQFEAETASCLLQGEKVLLVKPQTFMNESGRSVGPLASYYKVDLKEILVIYDDLDLPIGKIRLREKGSHGGHNGIRSLIQHLGTDRFKRIRVGIDRPGEKQMIVDYVLSPFPKEMNEAIFSSVQQAGKAALFWAEGHSFSETMNQFNGK